MYEAARQGLKSGRVSVLVRDPPAKADGKQDSICESMDSFITFRPEAGETTKLTVQL